MMKQNPFTQFLNWYSRRSRNVREPSAMVMSTTDIWGQPHSRMVLLKGCSTEEGFVFYTNYDSDKANQIRYNPKGCLLFYWPELRSQVRVEGLIVELSEQESNKYFQTRKYISKLGAHASRQSQPLPSQALLLWRVFRAAVKYGSRIPLPEGWGGYKLQPNMFEFWKEQRYRLHNRVRYKLENGEWRRERLYP